MAAANTSSALGAPGLPSNATRSFALCLYCVTGDEPSPDLLTRLLKSNRKSIRIPLAQGTGNPLHAAFEIVQQLALQGHPVPINLLLPRKSFLTLDGIKRQLDPDFNPWLETLAYASGVAELGAKAFQLPNSINLLRWLIFESLSEKSRFGCKPFGH